MANLWAILHTYSADSVVIMYVWCTGATINGGTKPLAIEALRYTKGDQQLGADYGIQTLRSNP